MKFRAALAGLVLVSSLAPTVLAGPATRPQASPASAAVLDIDGMLVGRDVAMHMSNMGAFAYDMGFLSPLGLEYPRGSGHGVLFASGVWLGAMVAGSPRVTVSEYSTEYAPGIASGGIPEIPLLPELRVYELDRLYADPAVRDAALQDYSYHAYPRGAPLVQLRGDGSLSIPGDHMTYAVFNDLDPTRHNTAAGATNPLQVEVRHTSWAYDRPGPMGQTVFMRFTLINRGPLQLEGMYFSMWSDPDVGQFDDDRVGSDPARSLAYGYNADDADLSYGSNPPAVGYDLLQGPFSAALGHRLPMTAMVGFVNGTDPVSAIESYRGMQGLTRTGTPIVDPFGATTPYMYSGDPVSGTGWVDASSADQRFLLSSGPFSMAPGQTQEVVVAVIVARGADRLESVALLRQYDDQIQAAFDANQLGLLDAPPSAPPARLAFAGARPNPAHGEAAVGFALPRPADAALDVLDLAGRRVASEHWTGLAAGAHTRPLPAAARALPAGIYLLRLTAGGEQATRRWVVLD